MFELWKAANGRKLYYIGKGETIKEAVHDGFRSGTIKWEDFKGDVITTDDIVDYIITARQDFIVIIK